MFQYFAPNSTRYLVIIRTQLISATIDRHLSHGGGSIEPIVIRFEVSLKDDQLL